MYKKEIVEALKKEDFSSYYKQADWICKKTKGNIVDVRAIIEISSICKRNCIYCGLTVDNKKAQRYRMQEEEIITVAEQAILAGYKTIVLQGGEDPFFEDGKSLERIIREIKRRDCAVTLSLGELSFDVLRKLREAGADRYLLRHETSAKHLYEYLHPSYRLEDRLNTLKEIWKLGYETGSGFMVGLPNQTMEDIAEDLLLLKNLQCHMAGIGPFISHPDTKLNGLESGSVELTKRCVAIARILLPSANLPVTTAVGVLKKEERKSAFSCGANVIMRKVNVKKYQDAYKIYPSNVVETNILEDRKEIERLIREAGKEPK